MDTTQLRRSRGYQITVKVGLVSYGLVHLIVAGIAVRVAFGGGGDASSQGALRQLAQQPLGQILLIVISLSLLVLVVWQGIEATVGRDESHRRGALRHRAVSVGRGLIYLALSLSALRIVLGTDTDSEETQKSITAQIMSFPLGQMLVGLVGAAVIGVGVAEIRRGVKHRFREDLDERANPPTLALGTVGYVAKGFAIVIVGALFGLAAATFDPEKAGGMDAALSTLREQPFGMVLLLVTAVGIGCFGLYCFVWAKNARY